MIIKPIKNEEDYRAALCWIDAQGDPAEGSEAYDLLDVLVTLVEAYETKNYPMGSPDPVAAIEYEMEKRGLTRQDLEGVIGPSGRVSEILNRQRPLTVTMIRRLYSDFQIRPDILITSYPLRTQDSTTRNTRTKSQTRKSPRGAEIKVP